MKVKIKTKQKTKLPGNCFWRKEKFSEKKKKMELKIMLFLSIKFFMSVYLWTINKGSLSHDHRVLRLPTK